MRRLFSFYSRAVGSAGLLRFVYILFSGSGKEDRAGMMR